MPDGNTHSQPSLEELIARYGDSSNTTWVEDKWNVWRFPKNGAAQGYALSSSDFLIAWGNPLCAREEYPVVIGEFLLFVKREGKKPIWACASREVQEILAEELGWKAVMVIQEDALDPTRSNPEENKEVRRHIKNAQNQGCKIIEVKGEPSEEEKKGINALIEEWKGGRKGTQVHTTDVQPWRDTEHRRYFYARDANGRVVGFLFIAKVERGWAIKDSLASKDAPKNLTEWLNTTAIHSLAKDDEHYLTFGPTPAEKLHAGQNLTGSTVKWLSTSYYAIQTSFLGNKREFRRKFKVEGEPLYVAFPPHHGLGKSGIAALMKVLTD